MHFLRFLSRRRGVPGLAGSVAVLWMACLGGCGGSQKPAQDDGRIFVVATTTMAADLVREIAGDRAHVVGLMGPGIDPHMYRPLPNDISAMGGARLIVYSGLHLEGKMGSLLEKMSRDGRHVVSLGDSLPKEKLISGDNADEIDPHFWGDILLWSECVSIVVEALSHVDPDGRDAYSLRGDAVRASLGELDTWARARLEAVPAARRILVTSHDAFGYFGRAYGFEVVAVQGISTATEAGLADVTHMIDFVKERSVPAIFVESSVSPAIMNRVSTDTGVKIGGELFSDATGTSEESEVVDGVSWPKSSYQGMMRHNINRIVEALQ
jgi:manganese/zinc/iron transport system substrate-binding protein